MSSYLCFFTHKVEIMPTSQALCEAYMAWKDNAKMKQKKVVMKKDQIETLDVKIQSLK